LKNPLKEIFKIAKKKLKNKDILVITSKVIALEQGGVVKLKEVPVNQKAKKLAKKYGVSPQFAELVIKESDKILGGVKGAILTFKNGVLMANAGIDASNAPKNCVVKLPDNLEKIADQIRAYLFSSQRQSASGLRLSALGIVISDSVCLPLRKGTHHFALAISGFSGIIDERGKRIFLAKK